MMVLVDFYSTGNLTCFLFILNLYSPQFLADWRAERRLQRKQHNLKAPQERGFRDEEIEDVSAESVRSERKSAGSKDSLVQ